MNKTMQIKHVKDRKKNIAFSVYLFFFSYGNRQVLIEVEVEVLAKLLTLMNNMNLSHSADSVVFYQAKLIQHAQLQGLIKIVKFHLSLV